MLGATKFYYGKSPAYEPTEEEMAAAEADGWTTRKSKYARKKRRQDKGTAENGNRLTTQTRGDKAKSEVAHENGEEHDDNTKKNKSKRGKADTAAVEKRKEKKKATTSSDENNVVDKSLADTLSRTFTAVDRQLIEELIDEMGLTSFDPDDAPLRARILNALIEKQQRLVTAPAESETDHEESDEKAHIEPEQETPAGPTEAQPQSNDDEAQTDAVEEEATESAAEKQKKKRRSKKKRSEETKEKENEKENESENAKEKETQKQKQKQKQKKQKRKQEENEFEADTDVDEKNERTQAEMSKKEIMINELNSFEPSESRSIELLTKWKSEMENNWNEFASIFEEVKGLEVLIDKWIYCAHFRNNVCERQFVDFLSCFLPGERDYHEFVMAQIMEICRCLDTLNVDKKKTMQDIMSNHCKQLLQVLIRGYANSTNTSDIATGNNLSSKVHHLPMPKPSSLFPSPSAKDPLSSKIRELDTCCENLGTVFQTLQQQHTRVEQLKPTSNDNFRRVYGTIKNDVNVRMNGLANERRKLQNELQMVEHERKTIENTINRSLSPVQSEANKIVSDIRTLTAQQKDYEKKLIEINTMLEQFNSKLKQLNDRIHDVKSQYAPKEEKLHSEHQNCSFQSVALEKEQKCYERVSVLADESWRKLEEWSQNFMEKYHGESEVCENQFIDQCGNYVYSLLGSKSFLLNRVEHLKQMVSDARQYQTRTKQLYGDVLIMKSLNFNADGEPHITFDTQVLEWIEKQLKQVIVKCRENVRKSSYQRFVLQLNAQLANDGYDAAFLKPFVDEIHKEGLYGGMHDISNASSITATTPLSGTGIISGSNIGHTHPHVGIVHTGGTSSINPSFAHSSSTRTHYGMPIVSTNTNPPLFTSNIIFPSAIGLSNANVNMSNPPIKSNIPSTPNFNVNPNLNLNPNSNTNVVLNRKPPVVVHQPQTDQSSHQPQVHQIPIFSKKTGPVMPKPPTVAKQTQTTTATSNSTAPTPQNDAPLAQRLRNSQRRPPILSETHQ